MFITFEKPVLFGRSVYSRLLDFFLLRGIGRVKGVAFGSDDRGVSSARGLDIWPRAWSTFQSTLSFHANMFTSVLSGFRMNGVHSVLRELARRS